MNTYKVSMNTFSSLEISIPKTTKETHIEKITCSMEMKILDNYN